MTEFRDYIDNINTLNREQLAELIGGFTEEDRLYAQAKAQAITREKFGGRIYIRGLIEFTNYCQNNCLYCGIRRGNEKLSRFRMSKEEILRCCARGYELGFRTFVLQGGEDPYFSDKARSGDDRMCDMIRTIRSMYPDCAITLSVGERSRESYRRLREAGADRYLLRHETADPQHYAKLHPPEMSYENRMECLCTLKELGYQTGCGLMVGSPFQRPESIADDLIFIRNFRPEMVGIGPFLPQRETIFADHDPGSVRLTLMLLSLIRITAPNVLLPATTALGSAEEDGRLRGIRAGANVYMPNLTPAENRDRYLLYDGKAGLADDAEHVLETIREKLGKEGYAIAVSRGDYDDSSSRSSIQG